MVTPAFRWIFGAAVAVVVLSGCGGSGGGTNFPTNNILPTTASTPSDQSSASSVDILAASRRAVTEAKSFRVVSSSKDANLTIAIDIRYGITGSHGTITLNKTPVQIIRVGNDTYIKAADAFWSSVLTSTQASAELSHIHGKWVRIPTTGTTFTQLEAFADKRQVVAQLVSSKNATQFLKGPTKKVLGVSAIPLTDHTDGAVIYIAATGKPYPVEVIGGKGTQAVGKFSEWDKAFSVAAPPVSQTYPLSLS